MPLSFDGTFFNLKLIIKYVFWMHLINIPACTFGGTHDTECVKRLVWYRWTHSESLFFYGTLTDATIFWSINCKSFYRRRSICHQNTDVVSASSASSHP